MSNHSSQVPRHRRECARRARAQFLEPAPLRVNAALASLLGCSDAAEFTLGTLTGLFATDEDQARLVGRVIDDLQAFWINVRHRNGTGGALYVLVRKSSDGDSVTAVGALQNFGERS